jgi:(2Fe-2S) ferredoxin
MPEFKAHLFVCTNDRGPGAKRESCGPKGGDALRGRVKEMCRARGLKGVRINSAGCLDQCEQGMVAVLYPKGEWFLNLKPEDAEKLVDAVEKAAKGE